MTIEQMRALVGLPEDATDAEVVAAYAAMLGGSIAAALVEPITAEEARKHLRLDSDADDAQILESLASAREYIENYTGLFLVRREVTEEIPAFSSRTKLRAWPVDPAQPVAVTYRDATGVDQTVAGASIGALTRPAIIYPGVGQVWPSARTLGGPASATFTAGFADAASVPKVIRQAMLVMLTAFYENREGGELFQRAEASARGLCRPFRSWR